MWKTRLTEVFACKVPIMLAPMAGVSGGALAAETCRAGGLGFIAAGYLSSLETIQQEVSIFRKMIPLEGEHASRLCIGFIGHGALGSEEAWARVERVLKEYRPAAVQFFAPSIARHPVTKQTNVEMAHEYGCKVVVQVGSIAEAREAFVSNVDAIIAQGSEAGGHGLRRDYGNGTLAFAARIVSMREEQSSQIPILAAGGIVDGRGLAAALALGCDGVVLGTRLWASEEALGNQNAKLQLASNESENDQVIRTNVIDQITNTYSSVPWPFPFDSVGALRNPTIETWHGKEQELDAALKEKNSSLAAEYKGARESGDYNIAAILAGEGVGDIKSVGKAYDIVDDISEEAKCVIQQLPRLLG
mmetsp:Transcript_10671/g.19477  ORF Transcript_10671/g.19477 Transcript_10671/m.19477 type:complete len:360 (+) Transcript_10671:123-1202(+)